MKGWPKTWSVGSYSIGLFPYWIGWAWGWRQIGKTWRSLDLGFVKIMQW